jgi:hypothetical protein
MPDVPLWEIGTPPTGSVPCEAIPAIDDFDKGGMPSHHPFVTFSPEAVTATAIEDRESMNKSASRQFE